MDDRRTIHIPIHATLYRLCGASSGLASCPGSRGGGEREPGTHCSRMRLIISNFCRFLRHRRLPTAMLRNNTNKLAAKLLSFVGLY